MAVFKCKMCGGDLEIQQGTSVAVCQYCGVRQTVPKLDDEKRTNLYNRANHFRRNNDYDKAMSIYEQILNEDQTDSEAYWSIVLCRYGVEYVEDPATQKRVPTINRTQFTSVFMDEDFKSALSYADEEQKKVYMAEAEAIDKIQQNILRISSSEEPFDVFICYKENDENGQRTPDSVLATDLYYGLTNEGFKVFFSRITLEDKLGTAYEPYIFSALNSAKVMIVLGTKAEYFNAVWVKNEWSRYLHLIKGGAQKTLIPAYKDMDPYDLPDEFSYLQAQDMSKLGFMQDLIRGIKKILSADAPVPAVQPALQKKESAENISPLLKRAFMFLEEGDYDKANSYCEKVLDRDPQNAMAYVAKLMAEHFVRKEAELGNLNQSISGSGNFKRAIEFADDRLKKRLIGYEQQNNQRIVNQRKKEENEKLLQEVNQIINGSNLCQQFKKLKEDILKLNDNDRNTTYSMIHKKAMDQKRHRLFVSSVLLLELLPENADICAEIKSEKRKGKIVKTGANILCPLLGFLFLLFSLKITADTTSCAQTIVNKFLLPALPMFLYMIAGLFLADILPVHCNRICFVLFGLLSFVVDSVYVQMVAKTIFYLVFMKILPLIIFVFASVGMSGMSVDCSSTHISVKSPTDH